ncbi:MAG TPA: sugar ABC transporter substrate-binding protein [Firmicutes bacterium]|jgi:ribose transport system substrate-binding protein|nr:sugar ABC transporter substrate-binding protein [Bacillota bacterium]
MKKAFLMLAILMLVMSVPFINLAAAPKALTFGYITPGPDTWYKCDVDGFVWAAKMLGIKTVVLNSNYDVQKEVSNIDSLITQGVDGMAVFSFNQQGAITAAQKCKEAGIPLVTVDNCGQALAGKKDIVAAVDFDWKAMGRNYAEYMAKKYPGKKVALITGMLEHLPVQMVVGSMKERMKELGKNEIVAVRDGKYDPSVAVNQAQDLVQSGTKFDILWIMNEDMAAAVIRYLKNQNLGSKYVVIAQNGSPVGLPLVKNGDLNYTISSSPGWEGMVSLLTLNQYVKHDSKVINQQIMLPVISVTKQNVMDKTKVVPWDCDTVWIQLTKQYFPKLGAYLPAPNKAPKP